MTDDASDSKNSAGRKFAVQIETGIISLDDYKRRHQNWDHRVVPAALLILRPPLSDWTNSREIETARQLRRRDEQEFKNAMREAGLPEAFADEEPAQGDKFWTTSEHEMEMPEVWIQTAPGRYVSKEIYDGMLRDPRWSGALERDPAKLKVLVTRPDGHGLETAFRVRQITGDRVFRLIMGRAGLPESPGAVEFRVPPVLVLTPEGELKAGETYPRQPGGYRIPDDIPGDRIFVQGVFEDGSPTGTYACLADGAKPPRLSHRVHPEALRQANIEADEATSILPAIGRSPKRHARVDVDLTVETADGGAPAPNAQDAVGNAGPSLYATPLDDPPIKRLRPHEDRRDRLMAGGAGFANFDPMNLDVPAKFGGNDHTSGAGYLGQSPMGHRGTKRRRESPGDDGARSGAAASTEGMDAGKISAARNDPPVVIDLTGDDPVAPSSAASSVYAAAANPGGIKRPFQPASVRAPNDAAERRGLDGRVHANAFGR